VADPHAFLAGALAGIGVALPLGAIGVLIVHEGLQRGWRPAAAAATGVALVDLAYAAVAVAAGTAVTAALDGRTAVVRLVGAVVLVAVALRGLWGLRRPAAAAPAQVPGHHVLLRFVALTAVNPLTAVYFVVLTAGLGDAVTGAAAGTRFALGVFLASWAWQLVLATAGALAGARLPGWARTATGVVGYLVVLGYAVRLALGA
jgi:arginine exporter protein ArgO